MAFVPLVPHHPASAKESGLTVSWTATGREHYQASINLGVRVVGQLGLSRPKPGEPRVRIHAAYCAETNRMEIRRAKPDELGFGLCWKEASAGRHSACLRLTLPGIVGDKRKAMACEHAVTEQDGAPLLMIHMPAWAQPYHARRATMQAAA